MNVLIHIDKVKFIPFLWYISSCHECAF